MAIALFNRLKISMLMYLCSFILKCSTRAKITPNFSVSVLHALK